MPKLLSASNGLPDPYVGFLPLDHTGDFRPEILCFVESKKSLNYNMQSCKLVVLVFKALHRYH